MEILILIIAMIIVGAVIGALAGPIFKGERPKGAQMDYFAAIVTAVVVGLIDWYVIPALGFSNELRLAGVILEPPIGALLVLWLIRRASS